MVTLGGGFLGRALDFPWRAMWAWGKGELRGGWRRKKVGRGEVGSFELGTFCASGAGRWTTIDKGCQYGMYGGTSQEYQKLLSIGLELMYRI